MNSPIKSILKSGGKKTSEYFNFKVLFMMKLQKPWSTVVLPSGPIVQSLGYSTKNNMCIPQVVGERNVTTTWRGPSL